jgi:hypothetical protein
MSEVRCRKSEVGGPARGEPRAFYRLRRERLVNQPLLFALGSHCSRSTTHYSLLTTHHSPPATRHCHPWLMSYDSSRAWQTAQRPVPTTLNP